jgi:hypothetical protein
MVSFSSLSRRVGQVLTLVTHGATGRNMRTWPDFSGSEVHFYWLMKRIHARTQVFLPFSLW